jgi:hypothetical protein
MEKINLKILDFYNLDIELNGIASNSQTKEGNVTGLLRERLPLVTKYWLTDLAKRVAAEKTAVEELKNELIKKYGVEDANGNINIPVYIDDEKDESEIKRKVINPEYVSFEKEFSELLNTEKELEYKPIKLSDLEKLETTENYVTLFKLVTTESV